MSDTARPRRSVLYVPADNARAVEKARALPCDAVVLDLEDSVAPTRKAEARAAALAALAAGGFGGREVAVRANALASPWGAADLAALRESPADAVLAPKISSAREAADCAAALGPKPLWAMVETCRAVLALDGIAAAGPRALVVGGNDLAKEMRCRPGGDRAPLAVALALTVTAARAHGLVALDGVHNALADPEGLARECRQGADLGFDGKTLIHPKQLGPCNKVFTPKPEDVAWSRRIIEAHAAAAARGEGVVVVDGKLVENLHVESARRVVGMADAIVAMEAGNG